MPQMRVFLSSTAYDLGMVRGQLGVFIRSLGHQVAMSEFSGVLYDPGVHTQKSCVQELATCDAVVLIIGSRWGSVALPEFIDEFREEHLDDGQALLGEPMASGKLSVTQLEAITAFREGIPMFVFVDRDVRSEARFYESNIDLADSGALQLPVMGDLQAAKYVFNFLKYVESRSAGNAIVEFGQIEDIQTHLRTQWSSWLQRMVSDARVARSQQTLVEMLDEKLEDLKAAMVSTLPDADARNVATGVLEFRLLCEFLPFLDPSERTIRGDGQMPFGDLLMNAGLRDVIPLRRARGVGPGRSLLVLRESVLEIRMSPDRFFGLESDWSSFLTLRPEERGVIYDTLRRDRRHLSMVRPHSLTAAQFDTLMLSGGMSEEEWTHLLSQ